MLDVIKTRIAQGYRTAAYPQQPPVLPDRFKGKPEVCVSKCAADCDACVGACPVQAIQKEAASLTLDLGACIFCGACEEACTHQAIHFTSEHSLAARTRQDLLIDEAAAGHFAAPLEPDLRRLFGRSLKLRQVSAGGCAACEADINVLNTLVFDLNRFGIQIVASPRHADGLLITGPVPENMALALKKTYDAVPSPKIVIAVGACAISGGMFMAHDEVHNGADALVPVDLFIPGCPPHPYTILDGLLRVLGKSK